MVEDNVSTSENNGNASENRSSAVRLEKRLFPVVLGLMGGVMVLMAVFIIVQIFAIWSKNSNDSFDMRIYVMPDPNQQATLEASGEEPTELQLNPTQQAQLREQIRRENMNIAINARDDAQDAVNSAQILLSFLEAAGFLIALALGAAAMYGFRNSDEMRGELEKENEKLRKEVRDDLIEARSFMNNEAQQLRKEKDQIHTNLLTEMDRQHEQMEKRVDLASRIADLHVTELVASADKLQQSTEQFEEDTKNLQQELKQTETTLDELQTQLKSLEKLGDDFKNTPEFFRYLMQAYHELQLRNHLTAYRAICKALSFDAKNPVALYYAGWLEIQYVPDTVNPNHMWDGMDHLAQAFELAPEWPSAIAAYGVALRRQATRETGDKRLEFFQKAEDRFLQALSMDGTLLDLNQESFWGPLAGLRRDRERLKSEADRDYTGAIKDYREAVSITPGSSYPRGNLASLYLWRYKQYPTPEHEKIALDTFDTTVRLAQIELALEPNDYYHIMDVAMAMTVLSSQGREGYPEAEAERQLDEALHMNPTPEMKKVSLRGWGYLMEYCPDEWTTLRANIEKARERIEASMRPAFDAEQIG